MITPEYISTGEKFLGVQRVKIRYRASDIDTIYLPFSRNNSIRLLEDVGIDGLFKTTLRTLPTGVPTNVVTSSASIRNEIPSVDELKQDDAHIFNTRLLNSSTTRNLDEFDDTEVEDLDVAFLSYVASNRVTEEPMIFFDESSKVPYNPIDPMEFELFSIYYNV